MNARPNRRTRTEAGDVPGAVWFRTGPDARARPRLSHAAIVATAVELLDRDGERKLSMRRLAERLDAHATSLYWHVATKEDVLDLALDAVFAEVDLPAAHADAWQGDVGAFMTGLYRVLMRHPWAAPLAGTRPLMGPNALRASEFVYTALAAGGFDGAELAAAAATISHYVIGAAATAAVWARRDDEPAARAAADTLVRDRADAYPTLAGHLPLVAGDDWDAHFERGARIVVAGLTAQAAGPAPRR